MKLSFTDPISKDITTFTEVNVSIDSSFKKSLGKDPADRYACDEEYGKIFPIKFHVTFNGHVESNKNGRLLISMRASCFIPETDKNKLMFQSQSGFLISLTREATGLDLGGHIIQESIAKIIRNSEARLISPIKTALLAEINHVKKHEELCSSAHASRARVAGLAHDQIKKGDK